MNVLHLNSELIFGGGLEKIIVDLITTNEEVSNYLCVINNKWSEKHLKKINKDSALLCNRKEGTRNPFLNLNTIYKAYRYIKEKKIDIIHCHDTFSLKFGYILKRLLNVKVILTVHHVGLYNSKLNKYPIDKYIAISEAVYKTIEKHIPNEKIELIYNGVNLDKYYAYRHEMKNNQEISISCVARIVPEIKGQDILIRALNVFKKKYGYKGFKCFFAGDSTDQKTLDELSLLINKFDLKENIEFLGNVERVEELYGKTDIFVLPSRNEGFGLVVVEALAAGCSVIVSRLDGPLEIIKKDEEYGLCFEKENYKELAEKLHLLATNESYQKRYINNNKTKEYLEREYSLDRMIERYNKVYKTCLGEKK